AIPIIAVKAVARVWIRGRQFFQARAECTVLVDGVIEQVHIEVSVAIIIKEYGLGTEPGNLQPVFFCLVPVPGAPILTDPLSNQELLVRGGQSAQSSHFTNV